MGDESRLVETRRVLDAVPERIVLCRRDGTIVLVNRLARSLFGRTDEELEGSSFPSLVAVGPGDPAPLLDRLLARTEADPLRAAIVHQRGVQIEVELAASPFLDDGLVAVVLRQLPEQRVPEAARAERTVLDETYRRVFEDAPVGILHFDDHGVITTCNEPLVRIIGSSKRVLVGLDMTTLPFRPIAEAVKKALTGQLARFEGTYPSATADKHTQVRVEFAPLVDAQGRTVGGVGIAEDVTERARAELALRRSFESVRTLIENAPDAIAVSRGDALVLVNPSLVRMLGYESSDALLKTRVPDLLHPEERAASAMRRDEAARGGATTPSREVRLLRKDGTTLLADMATIAVLYEDEPALVTFARDVTERRRIDASLAQADRMASIGTLAAGVAHEINNPLAYIMANLELMERLIGPTHELHPMLRDARDGCERVRSIVRDLRTFSRADSEKLAPVDVRKSIESAVKMAQAEIRHRARLVRELDDVSPVMGDEMRLSQVVLNLLLNAVQAIPEGASEEHEVRVGTRTHDGKVEVFVADDGEGMSPQVMRRLFEPFFTTKPVGIGTGLGLPICRGIVQSYGGTIEVESEVGHGSVFHVLLPALEEPAVRTPPPQSSRTRRARIVVIDDDVRLGTALRASLSAHDVTLATSGREALELLLGAAKPDLILCDMMMPDVSGLGVYEALRRDRPELCEGFVFMTGGVFPETSIQFVAGPDARKLHKPFTVADVELLLDQVRAVRAA